MKLNNKQSTFLAMFWATLIIILLIAAYKDRQQNRRDAYEQCIEKAGGPTDTNCQDCWERTH